MSTYDISDAINRMKRFFDPHIRTALSRWRVLENFLEITAYESKSIIKNPGRRENVLRFILSGCAVKLIGREDFEECLDYYFEDEFLSDIMSLHSGDPSDVYFKCIEPVKVASVKKFDLMAFYRNSTVGAQLGRIIAEKEIVKVKKRSEILSGKIEFNYNKLMEEEPRVIQRIPQVYIATYLGTSPQNLSRVRRGV